MHASDRLLAVLALLFFSAVMLGAAWLAYARPDFNWDMIPYVALADGPGSADVAARHDRAYETVRTAAPARDWIRLTESNRYRAEQYRDPGSFDAQLGMYRIKAGYVAVARLMSRTMPVIAAYRVINVVALLLILVTAIWWMTAGHFAQAAFFVAPALMINQLHQVGRVVTPDLLCAALALLGLALLRRGPWPAAAAVVAAATLVRPDFILFPAVLAAGALLMRIGRKEALGCFAASAAAFLIAMLVADYPGWWAHLSVSLIRASEAVPFSAAIYLDIVARATIANLLAQPWPATTIILSGAWLLLRDSPVHEPRQADLIFLALLLSLALRCAIFPLSDQRLYLPTILMCVMMVAERWSPRFGRARPA